MARMDDGSYNIALKGTKTLSFDFQNVDDFINQTEAPEGHTFDEKTMTKLSKNFYIGGRKAAVFLVIRL